ncbi:MAG TPA: UMP kinase [Synergistaceae bacterium]|nr:UMP kinase [Synergistaceae bacterium]HQF91077.1 UMP kinase [Synergistaceae bacterium]HQK24407.1 UMP kinase [Synergistaceae bacterium]
MGMWRRVLLKLSGEVLAGGERFGLDFPTVDALAEEVADVARSGVEIAMVVGGGNIFRGAQASPKGIERAQADNMGMLATVINALAFQDSLERAGMPCRVQTAIEMREVAEPFIRRRAVRHLEKGRVVIFAAGTGSPYFSTDTAAALRAAEIHADCLLKATKVDGIYERDPRIHPDAAFFSTITYAEALRRRIGVMDAAAFSLCMENRIPTVVFNILHCGNLRRLLVENECLGTRVYAGEEETTCLPKS